MTNHNWKHVTPIAPGGTVFSLSADAAGQIWLAGGAGIFRQNEDRSSWSPLAPGQPLSRLNAFLCAGKTLFAGGGQGEVVYSTDGGRQWYRSRTEETGRAVTCFAAGPDFSRRGTILAGTDGAGIQRSTDGGRNWQLANFGLEDFSVISLATAPAWDRREAAFAATEYGFYRSPNGGRAWKKAETGLEGVAIQTIAVSPNFAEDRTVLVGAESKGVFRSTDGGKSWQAWGEGLAGAGPTSEEPPAGEHPPINTLWLHPEFGSRPVCVAGTGDGQLFYSADGGATWHRTATAEGPVLCLEGSGQVLYAGLHDQGLLYSPDEGQSWHQVTDLAARSITRLVSGADRQLFAYGPLEGAWHSSDEGRTWIKMPRFGQNAPLLTLAASPPADDPDLEQTYAACLLAATPEGLDYSSDQGQSWQRVLPGEEVVAVCFSPHFAVDGRVWAGTGTGSLLGSDDGGVSWTARPAPKTGLPLVAVAVWPEMPNKGSETLAAVTFAPDSQQMTLWRSTDGATTWQQWQQVRVSWPVAHLDRVEGPELERVIICLDRRCWISTAAGWQGVMETEQPVLRLARPAGDKGVMVLTPRKLFCSPNGVNWSGCDEGLADQILFDLALLPATDEEGQTALVLTTGGNLWIRRV